jgi:hypothetical protein
MRDLTTTPRSRPAAFSPRTVNTRKREAELFVRQTEVRSVRTAPWLSRPSMGRDTLCIPSNSVASGRMGRGSNRRRLRHVVGIGGTYTRVSGATRARCADESSSNAHGNRGRSGPISDGRTPERRAPAQPAASDHAHRPPGAQCLAAEPQAQAAANPKCPLQDLGPCKTASCRFPTSEIVAVRIEFRNSSRIEYPRHLSKNSGLDRSPLCQEFP